MTSFFNDLDFCLMFIKIAILERHILKGLYMHRNYFPKFLQKVRLRPEDERA